METDKHYFFEGLFIIVFSVAAALFAVWLGSSGRHADVIYRIHFPDSVSGLTAGDPVKFRGVDVGTVKAMEIDPVNTRLVRVDVRLRKGTPVMTDTRASLEMKGITGVVFIELSGGDPAALAPVPQDPCGAAQRQEAEHGQAVMVQQFAGEEPFQYLAGAKGVPLPGRFPTAVIDV